MAAPNFGTDCGPMSPLHAMVTQMSGGMQTVATLQNCTDMMSDVAGAALGIGQAGAQGIGLWDGISGLQGFTIRETTSGLLMGCDPMGAGTPIDNVVACCKTCNRMKYDMDIDSFLEHIDKLYNYLPHGHWLHG